MTHILFICGVTLAALLISHYVIGTIVAWLEERQ